MDPVERALGSIRSIPSRIAMPLLTAAVYYAAAVITLVLTGARDGVAAVWISNALLIGAVVRLPRGERPLYLLLGAIASATANHQAGLPILSVLGFTLANMTEVAVATALFDRLCPARAFFTNLRHLGAFAVAAIVSAAISATLATAAATADIAAPGAFWLSWFTTDTLGMFVVVPPMLTAAAIWQRDPDARSRHGPLTTTVVLLGVLALNALVFSLPPLPISFVPLVALLFATAWLGPLGTTISLLITAIIGSLMTAAGHGPLAPMTRTVAGAGTAVLFFQFYLVLLFASSLPIASLLVIRRRLLAEAARSDRLHRSIIDRSHALFFETDREGRWIFLSPTWKALTGRPVEESLGGQACGIHHPEDEAAILRARDEILSGAKEQATLDLRYRAADGSWRWGTVCVAPLRDEERGDVVGLHGTMIDIHDRVAAERARAESEAQYRLLADHSQDMIFRVGRDGTRRYASPAVRTVLGWEPETLIGRPALEIVHPEDRSRVQETLNGLTRENGSSIVSYRQRRKDGGYVWLEAVCRLVGDPATGTPEEIISTVRDISRRRAAELEAIEAAARLHENHRMLGMAEAMAHIGHWRLVCADGASLYWSDETYRIHGLEPGKPITLEAALAALHPEDREETRALLMAGERYDHNIRLIRPDGAVRRIAVHAHPDVTSDGITIGMFGVIMDITERTEAENRLRESEAQYRLLAEYASDIVFRLSPDGRYTYLSPSTEAVTGYTPAEMMGHSPVDHIHPEDAPAIIEGIEALHREGPGAQRTVSYRRRRKDGTWQWLEASARLALTSDGSREIVGMARDISDRKLFEAELLRAREVAERAAHEARQIAATDELTGLASRRMFMGRLVGEVTAAATAGTPLSVALLDVDHFKRVNDHYGHAAGDRVLQSIAGTASRMVRSHDLVGRIGGEEFAILMPGTTAEAAATVGERLRAAVENGGDDHPELPRVTVSIGVAALGDGSDAASLLAAADYALYQAKAQGRNLLRLAS